MLFFGIFIIMCYRTKLNAGLRKIEETFEACFIEPEKYHPLWEINAFDFPCTPVITDEAPNDILFFQWGLIPYWAKDDQIKKVTLNSKIETCKDKPAFKNAVENRCLIIANGFYEWQWLDPKGKQKKKYLIQPKDQEIFAFAGIYSIWKSPQKDISINSYSILTTEANEIMSTIHNNKKRMPVVLKGRDQGIWLGGSAIENFAFPYEVELVASPV